MQVETAWVRPPKQITGMDHLAVQAPCINIYGRLLPGITNVTDRARYYSFYPWIVWALEKQGHKFNDSFIDLFRKADCLFTLIAHRHAHKVTKDREFHSGAMIGSANLAKQISDIREDKAVRLSEYAHREEGKHKYFKNKLGGLGQYYIGVFCELNIMGGTVGAGISNTNQIGKQIAEAFDKGVKRDLFLQTLAEDAASVQRLDELGCFCPCRLINSPEEHNILCDLFFVKGMFADVDTLPRKRSLQTILYLADALSGQKISIDIDRFRGCIYSGSLPDGSSFDLPERLEQNLNKWAIYQRNELLSIAIQGLFYVLLDAYEESGLRLDSVAELCEWFLTTPEAQQLSGLDMRFEELVDKAGAWMAPLSNWTDTSHEIQLAGLIEQFCKKEKTPKNRTKILRACVNILLALKSRQETAEGYGEFVFPGNYFRVYPVNLRSFLVITEKVLKGRTLRDCLVWLCSKWGVEIHLRVALRKLRGQSQSTFRIRPSDNGLEVIEVPVAVYTSPRFRQTLQILKDIGALREKEGCLSCSSLGQELREVSGE